MQNCLSRLLLENTHSPQVFSNSLHEMYLVLCRLLSVLVTLMPNNKNVKYGLGSIHSITLGGSLMKKVLSLLMAALFAVSLSVATFADDKPASGTKEAATTTEGKKKSKKTKKTSPEKKGETEKTSQEKKSETEKTK